MSGNRREIVRRDLESAVTRRYDRNAIEAAIDFWDELALAHVSPPYKIEHIPSREQQHALQTQ